MKMKKLLAIVLTVVMLCGMLPVAALAEPELESITLSVFVAGVDQVGRNVDGEIDKTNHTITFTLPEGVVKNSADTVLTLAASSPEALLIEMDEAGYFELDYKQDQVLTIGGVEYTVTVKEAEVTNPFTGSGTVDDPYLIPDATTLAQLSERYNAVPYAFSEKYWKQTANIDFYGLDIDFIPIGSSYETRFIGIFDGNGFTISNLRITYSEDSAGLFGNIGDGTIIKNVTMDSSCEVVSSAAGVGGIVGSMPKDAASRVENCKNYATVTSNYGIEGEFLSTTGSVGGIVGAAVQPNGIIIGCENYGNVSQNIAGISNAGGIVGSAYSTKVVDCHNYGNVTAPSAETWSGAGNGSAAGGITAVTHAIVAGCSNSGTVTGGAFIGGISGTATQGTLEGCYNTGTIVGNASDVNICAIGGIAGSFAGSYFGDCYNAGEIIAPSGVTALYAGAIIGQATATTIKEITNNYLVITEESEAFGTVNLETAVATPLTAAELKSAETVTDLNNYPEPWSLYKTTWAADSGSTHGGYPVIQSVEEVQSFYAEIKSFSVALDGKTYNGIIDGNEISIVLPYDTTTVNPTVTVSDKATVSPADGASVDLSSGPVIYTVTAENGTKVVTYTVKATIPASPVGLAALRLYTTNVDILAAEDFAQDTLSYTASEDDQSLIVLKNINNSLFISPIPAEPGAKISASLNGGAAKSINPVTSIDKNGGSLVLWGPSVADAMHPDSGL